MPNSQLISDYIKHLEAIRKDSRERFHQSAIRWNELSNSRSSDLSKRLFTIAALILPLSVLPLTQSDFTQSLSILVKILLFISWICFIASLIFGAIHLSLEANFFQKWAKQDGDRSAAYSDSIFTTSATDAYNRLNDMEQESNRLVTLSVNSKFRFLYLQEGFLLAGIILIGIVLSIKLFTPAIENKPQVPHEVRPYNVIIEHRKEKERRIHSPIISITPTATSVSPSASFKSQITH